MVKTSKKLFALVMLMFFSSCLSMGRNFPSRTDWLKKNKTTQKDLHLLLGKPVSVGNSGGVDTWTYGFYSYKVMEKPHYKELKIYWNPDRSVKHYIFNSSFPADIAGRGKGIVSGKKMKSKPSPRSKARG